MDAAGDSMEAEVGKLQGQRRVTAGSGRRILINLNEKKGPAVAKEAQARIRINHLLEAAGWRFFDEDGARANLTLRDSTRP